MARHQIASSLKACCEMVRRIIIIACVVLHPTESVTFQLYETKMAILLQLYYC